VAHSYIHYLEQNWARTIPLNYKDRESFQDILPKLDGVLLPGGNTNLTDFTKNSNG